MVCGKAEYYMLLGIAICYSPEAIWRSCLHVPERAFYMHVLFTRTAPIHNYRKLLATFDESAHSLGSRTVPIFVQNPEAIEIQANQIEDDREN